MRATLGGGVSLAVAIPLGTVSEGAGLVLGALDEPIVHTHPIAPIPRQGSGGVKPNPPGETGDVEMLRCDGHHRRHSVIGARSVPLHVVAAEEHDHGDEPTALVAVG